MCFFQLRTTLFQLFLKFYQVLSHHSFSVFFSFFSLCVTSVFKLSFSWYPRHATRFLREPRSSIPHAWFPLLVDPWTRTLWFVFVHKVGEDPVGQSYLIRSCQGTTEGNPSVPNRVLVILSTRVYVTYKLLLLYVCIYVLYVRARMYAMSI